jgi:hypothetical protein
VVFQHHDEDEDGGGGDRREGYISQHARDGVKQQVTGAARLDPLLISCPTPVLT